MEFPLYSLLMINPTPLLSLIFYFNVFNTCVYIHDYHVARVIELRDEKLFEIEDMIEKLSVFHKFITNLVNTLPISNHFGKTRVLNMNFMPVILLNIKPRQTFYAPVAPCNSGAILNNISCFTKRY